MGSHTNTFQNLTPFNLFFFFSATDAIAIFFLLLFLSPVFIAANFSSLSREVHTSCFSFFFFLSHEQNRIRFIRNKGSKIMRRLPLRSLASHIFVSRYFYDVATWMRRRKKRGVCGYMEEYLYGLAGLREGIVCRSWISFLCSFPFPLFFSSLSLAFFAYLCVYGFSRKIYT